MAKVYTTEITSEAIASDNPYPSTAVQGVCCGCRLRYAAIFSRLVAARGEASPRCLEHVNSFTAVDKIKEAIDELQKRFPAGKFISMNLPPLTSLADNTYDFVVSFQVIEHIENDALYLQRDPPGAEDGRRGAYHNSEQKDVTFKKPVACA